MAARTAEGSAVLAQSEGFKQYLVTAEANQIKWEEAQDIFSRYLPYAIVFGVASQWAGTFRAGGRGGRGRRDTRSRAPLWYVGDAAASTTTASPATWTRSPPSRAAPSRSTPGSSGGSAASPVAAASPAVAAAASSGGSW